jgi:uncharacterized protein YqeY
VGTTAKQQDMLKTKINADYLIAFKGGDHLRKMILSVVKGEIQTREKNLAVADLTDEEVTKILQKTQKSLKETISLSGDQKSKDELAIIEEYLPKEMTRDEIEAKIREVVGDGPVNIGLVMKAFAGLPADRSLVSKICQEYQSN